MSSKTDDEKLKLSRRTFITALASLPVLSLPWNSADAASTFTPFSFVYITDVHLTTGVADGAFKLLQESQLFLQETIKSVNALKPNFVIFGGDQIETLGAKGDANWQLFIDLVQGLNAPWTFVLGEQDVSGKVPVDKMKEFGIDFKGRGVTSSEPYWSMDPVPGVHLIGLDTSQANSTTGEIQPPQIDWLKKDLQANRGKFTIIASHHPLLAPPPYDGGPPLDDYIIPNGSDAREIIGTSTDVRMVLSGHLYMNKIQVERDVYHISCAGLNVYPCQYKLFKVSKDAITMESFPVAFPALVKKGLKSLESSGFATKINRRDPSKIIQLCEGLPADQNAILSLGPNKSVKELSKKQVKEDEDKRDEELDKQAELARNKNGKGKKGKHDIDKDEDGASEKTEKKGKKGKGESAEDTKSKEKEKSAPKSESKESAPPASDEGKDAVPDKTDSVPKADSVPAKTDSVPDKTDSAPRTESATPETPKPDSIPAKQD